MDQQKISRREMLKFSFNTLIDNFGFWIGLILTIFGILLAASIVLGIIGVIFSTTLTFPFNILVGIPILLIIIYLVGMIIAGVTQIGLNFYDQKDSIISRLWKTDPWAPINLLIGALLYSIMVCIGLLLLVIPGIYIAIKFWFFTQIIVDKNIGPIAAFKESARITKSRFLEIFILILITALVGLVPFVGAILALLCSCYVYRRLEPKISVQPLN